MFCVMAMQEDPRPIFSVLAEGWRISFKILWYMALYFGPSMWWSCDVHLAEKLPQYLMSPPPCLTVGMVLFGFYSSSKNPKLDKWKKLDGSLWIIS